MPLRVLTKIRIGIRQLLVFTRASLELVFDAVQSLKVILVSRMFWGRGSLYRTSFHVLTVAITTVFFFTGILTRFGSVGTIQALDESYGAVGNTDLLSQGSSLTAVLALDEGAANYRVFNHKVKAGETIDSIAKQYDVHPDTIIWANDTLINPFSPSVREGMQLKIPEINGVLYTVKSGDNLDTVVSKVRGSDRFSIIELNDLVPPKYTLKEGQRLFIPAGELAPPPLPGLQEGIFAHPLTHPACDGYRYVRGFTSYHSGVDWAKGGGCPIRAIAAGVVTKAGWIKLGGYSVVIDHGNGIESYYYHGNGEFWVKPGDFVRKGQNIMYMGNSGNSTGTHLHLTLRQNGANVNPARYVPLYD